MSGSQNPWSPRGTRVSRDPGPEYVNQITSSTTRAYQSLIALSAFCVLTLTAPDAQLVSRSRSIELPLVGVPINFMSFLIIGPALVLGRTAYLHVFYDRVRSVASKTPDVLPPTLFTIPKLIARSMTWTIFYLLPAIVVHAFAWKAAPHPWIGMWLARSRHLQRSPC